MSICTVLPQLVLTIDQGNNTGHVPCFQPGDTITGAVKIAITSPIQVLHLRVVFFGHVELHGDKPHEPLRNGIFDYHKTQQLVSTGVRIARRPTFDDHDNPPPLAESSRDAMKRRPTVLPDKRQHHRSKHSNASIIGKSVNARRGNSSNSSSSSTKETKTPLDKETEKLIQLIATKDKSQATMMHPSLSSLDYPPSHIYDVSHKQQKVRYRVPISSSKLLPASFTHPHCPISYYAIAIMLCKELESEQYYVTYAKLPIDFNPPVNVLSTTYAGLLRENYRLSLSGDSLLSRLLTPSQRPRRRYNSQGDYSDSSFFSISSSSSLCLMNNAENQRSNAAADSDSHENTLTVTPRFSFFANWWYRFVQQKNAWIPLEVQSKYDKVLDCTLELPRRAFCRGQALPSTVRLVNAAGVRIAMVVIEMKLVRHIVMTCGVDETVTTDIEFEATSTFYGDEVDPPTIHSDTFTENNNDNVYRPYDTPTPPSTPPLKPEARSKMRQPFFLFTTRHMEFDLSTVAHIPQHCPCSIMSKLTRDTFEMGYEWIVKAKVLEAKQGPRLDASLDDRGDRVIKYYAARDCSFSSVASSDYRIHVLEPSKMNILVGNTACKI